MNKYTVNREGWRYADTLYKAVTGNCYYFESKVLKDVIEYCLRRGYEIEQRYTDQQIELLQKDKGWIAGDWDKCPIDQGMFIEVKFQNSELDFMGYADGVGWARVIAYRLVTNDHYIKGKRVVVRKRDYVDQDMTDYDYTQVCEAFIIAGCEKGEAFCYEELCQNSIIAWAEHGELMHYCDFDGRKLTPEQVLNAENAKPKETMLDVMNECVKETAKEFAKECVKSVMKNDSPDGIERDGEGLPLVRVEIEFAYADEEFEGRTTSIIAIDDGEFWAKLSGNEKSNLYKLKLFKFRPLQTEREKVIEKALAMAIDNPTNIDGLLNMYYDADMLKLPEGE